MLSKSGVQQPPFFDDPGDGIVDHLKIFKQWSSGCRLDVIFQVSTQLVPMGGERLKCMVHLGLLAIDFMRRKDISNGHEDIGRQTRKFNVLAKAVHPQMMLFHRMTMNRHYLMPEIQAHHCSDKSQGDQKIEGQTPILHLGEPILQSRQRGHRHRHRFHLDIAVSSHIGSLSLRVRPPSSRSVCKNLFGHDSARASKPPLKPPCLDHL